MSDSVTQGLLAIDVGSSRVKLGWYPATTACTSDLKPSQLPIAAPKLCEPDESLAVSHVGTSPEKFSEELNDWLEQLHTKEMQIVLASVHAEAATLVQNALGQKSFSSPRRLTNSELPIEVLVEQPEKVGIDRLLNAVSANRLREAGRPAIVVDLGTANTVDLITADGAFAGGSILPGIAMSAKVLHESTSSLPHLSPRSFDLPVDVVGKSTPDAIAAGLYWGAVGAVSELITRMSADLDSSPQLFVTGGDARLIAPNLMSEGVIAKYVPHMVLAGIQISAEELL